MICQERKGNCSGLDRPGSGREELAGNLKTPRHRHSPVRGEPRHAGRGLIAQRGG